MERTALLPTLITALLAGPVSAQLEVLPSFYWASAVTNNGLVGGYMAGGTTWQLWNPDSGTTQDIGGMSPDGEGAGQARFSADGQRMCGTAQGTLGSEMAYQDLVVGDWTALGSLGSEMDGNASSAWGISGDGQTVVGLGWLAGFLAHAMAWNPVEGVMDLGTLYPGSSTRANAVSADGSVVVGWQDFNGPWKSAVWRKDPAGGYYPNEYLLIDPLGSATDEFNQIGECSAVSADGTVIGGYGDFANNDEPWIWSLATGVVNLGALPNMGRGFVSSISADGSVVVGWFDGLFFGDPRKAFIWTATGGLQDLNTYATDALGVVLGGQQLYTASDISPDGRYITGTGVADDMFAYRLDRGTTTGITALDPNKDLVVWPNPTTDRVCFQSDALADLTIVAVDGAVVHRSQVKGDVRLDVSGLAPGVYTMVLRNEGSRRTRRLVKQ